jgi:hypothetical protein
MLTPVTRVVSRHPLATFFVLAFALAWWPVLPFDGKLFPHGPFIAVLIVLALTEERPGVGALLRRLGYWRVGIGWYAVAIGLPFAVHMVAGMLTVLLGAPAPTLAQLPDWSALAVTVGLILVIGGQWEEPGWRGYAQPSLEAGRSALAAALLLGVIGIGWHLPLMLHGLLPWSELLVIPALFIVWAWAYQQYRWQSGHRRAVPLLVEPRRRADPCTVRRIGRGATVLDLRRPVVRGGYWRDPAGRARPTFAYSVISAINRLNGSALDAARGAFRGR